MAIAVAVAAGAAVYKALSSQTAGSEVPDRVRESLSSTGTDQSSSSGAQIKPPAAIVRSAMRISTDSALLWKKSILSRFTCRKCCAGAPYSHDEFLWLHCDCFRRPRCTSRENRALSLTDLCMIFGGFVLQLIGVVSSARQIDCPVLRNPQKHCSSDTPVL
jgi:hypothetical protein